MTPDPLTAIVDQLAAHGEQLTRLDAREASHHATLTALLAGLTDRLTPDRAGQEPGGYQPGPPPAWWTLTADARQEPLARLRGWVDQVYRPGYGHLAAALAPCWPAHDLCLYGIDIALSPVVRAVPAAGTHPRPGLRPGRIPGPHPARPGRPAQDRDHRLRPPPHPRPLLEHAMTDATLRRALAYAARGWPVFPCQPGQKIPATTHGYRDATTDPDQITAWFSRHPGRNLAIATGAPGPDVLDVDQHGQAGNGYAAFRQLQRGRAARRRRRLRAHPQRRPARLLHRHRPALRPPARLPPGLPVGRRVRPGPALPGRRPSLPGPGHHRPGRSPGLGRRHRPPAPSAPAPPAPAAAGPGSRPRPRTTWPAGSPPSPRATATPACSGPPTAPSKRTRPPT